ncbi:MAG TPA: bifunctional DNA-formamidopyrimidine glycosylase/DNA-(apurinic or apyrimidinic site) lyase [Alphaproteobacteria bacterium]|nr:bifunctional DNA-formamidopyrimidine glycosylase/DNA-(apurinic or apyrimidinic site) lyase [Alphaproteobacteria bacterium]
MPELPEVETVCRGLAARLVGRRLARVIARRRDLRAPLPARFAEKLEGRKVEGIDRRAKYILVRLEGGVVLLAHLGMSGRMVIADHAPPGPHDHVIFVTDDGTEVRFCDHRRFGLMTLTSEATWREHPLLKGLGPEPLGDGFNGAALSAALGGKATPIKAALLDQRVVAGLGNIYVCESLYRAGVSPRRLAGSCVGARAERLVAAIRAVLEEAIAAGGSSLRDHVQPSGELGYFQHRWAVYGREGEACPRCAAAGEACRIKRIQQSGRSSFFCSRRQR